MKLNSVPFSLEIDIKVHFVHAKENDLKWSRKEIRLTSEKLTVGKNKQIAQKRAYRMYKYVG